MKKLLFILTLIMVASFALYNKFAARSQASNNSHTYEYYYNEILSEDETHMASYEVPLTGALTAVSGKNTPNTDPSSMTVLVNKDLPLPDHYIPENLVVPDVLFNFNYYNEKKLMRSEASDALEQLFAASEDAGLSLCAISGYRSYIRQKEIYLKNVRTKGLEQTSLFSAMPGCSEHQSGLAIDVSTASVSNRLEEVFAGTPEGKWLARNAHLFGFVIRYPKNKSQITGYAYEPWHLRFVGADLAAILYREDLSLEEYYNYKPSHNVLNESSYGNNTDIESSDEPIPEQTLPPVSKKTPAPTKEPKKSSTPEETPIPKPAKTPEPSEKPAEPSEKPAEPAEKPTEPAESAKPTDTPYEPAKTEEPPFDEASPAVSSSPENSGSSNDEQLPIETNIPVLPELPVNIPEQTPETILNTAAPDVSQG